MRSSVGGGVSRADFLATASSLALSGLAQPFRQIAIANDPIGTLSPPVASAVLFLRRAEDACIIKFSCYGLQLDSPFPGRPYRLIRSRVRETDDPTAYIVIELPSQHVGESVNDDVGSYARGRLSGPSRIAFTVPNDRATSYRDGIPLDDRIIIENLQSFELSLFDTLDAVQIEFPDMTQTAIELPYRLILSTFQTCNFLLGAEPVAASYETLPVYIDLDSSRAPSSLDLAATKVHELWHARLVQGATSRRPIPSVKAIYNSDRISGIPAQPFKMSLDAEMRCSIVEQTVSVSLTTLASELSQPLH